MIQFNQNNTLLEMEDNCDWPILDFSKFENEMISGLTLDEICKVLNPTYSETIAAGHDDQGQSSRFGASLEMNEVKDLNSSVKSKNTLKRDKWASNIFVEWLKSRDTSSNYLEMDDTDLVDTLPRFIHEVRRKDGKRYPAASLVSIIAGIQNTFPQDRNINFFRLEKFSLVRDSLDSSMKISNKELAEVKRKSASTVSFDDEERLWECSFGEETPKKLLQTLFFLNGIHFALRGGEEHSNLLIEQFKIEERNGKKCLVYTEVSSKTYVGGLKNVRTQPKVVVHFESQNKKRCHVALFENFLKLRPRDSSRFYLRPLSSPRQEQWFSNRPIGKNQLCKYMKNIYSQAGLSSQMVTNHSLRATCATRLFHANVDEQLIMERTGHRSVTGVRAYKRTSDFHLENCSAIIDDQFVKRKVANSSERQTPFSVTNNFFMNNCTVTINSQKSDDP